MLRCVVAAAGATSKIARFQSSTHHSIIDDGILINLFWGSSKTSHCQSLDFIDFTNFPINPSITCFNWDWDWDIWCWRIKASINYLILSYFPHCLSGRGKEFNCGFQLQTIVARTMHSINNSFGIKINQSRGTSLNSVLAVVVIVDDLHWVVHHEDDADHQRLIIYDMRHIFTSFKDCYDRNCRLYSENADCTTKQLAE